MKIKSWFKSPPDPAERLTVYTVDAAQRRDELDQYKVRSLIAEGVKISGELVSDVGMAIDGEVDGGVTITGESAALIVRSSAWINGPVEGPIVVIRGTVTGNIQGHFVRLYPGAKVEGNIAATRLIVDDGAELISHGIGSGECVKDTLAHLPAVMPTPQAALTHTTAPDQTAPPSPPSPAQEDVIPCVPQINPLAWAADHDKTNITAFPVGKPQKVAPDSPTSLPPSGTDTQQTQHQTHVQVLEQQWQYRRLRSASNGQLATVGA